MLPTFFVIGAYKSGTTSLYRYLGQHPQIYVSPIKEPSFFAFGASGHSDSSAAFRKSTKTLAEYEQLFAHAEGFSAIGDVSPEYMTSRIAARNIHNRVPHAKLIAILRNPIERAYSDFLMYRRDGLEPECDFSKALDLQSTRALSADPTGHYVSTGFYGSQLARYYDAFPSSQIKVVLMDELEADALQTLSHIFSFLSVDPAFVPANLAVHNRSGETSNAIVGKIFQYRTFFSPIARTIIPDGIRTTVKLKLESYLNRPALNPADRRFLKMQYAEDVELLESLTGKSCRHWLE